MATKTIPQSQALRDTLTAEILKQRLTYNPNTGIFIWNRNGKVAGHKNPRGYISIRIDGQSFLAHRLAHLYMTGQWPIGQVDHKTDKSNRWENLRPATNAENLRNTQLRVNNITGYKGVSLVKKTGKFYACIMINYKSYSLGHFNTAKEAHTAYCKAAEQLHGDFARFK